MVDLQISDLVVQYTRGGEVIRPIDGLTLDVKPGSLVILLGPSGCGKTTLLSCIGGILSPTSGKICVGGIDVTSLNRSELTEYRRNTVGIVFQAFNLVSSLTALENVMVPLWSAGLSRHKAQERAHELLCRVGLSDRITHRPGDLSGGQQQRVAVARAVALDPPLLVADEPTAHLDYVQAEGVLQLIRELASGGRVVVVATHDIRIVPFADHVVKLVADFDPVDRDPETVRLAKGDTLFEQGSAGKLVYIVDEGKLEVKRENLEGYIELHKVVTAGESVGEIGPLFRMPRAATAVALTDATVTGYTVQAFRRRLENTSGSPVIKDLTLDVE